MILSAWLSEAAGEEQTSILHLILKVHIDPLILDHWPIMSFFLPEYCCSNGCLVIRYYAISLYTKHFLDICLLYCRVLTVCDFIGLQVCCPRIQQLLILSLGIFVLKRH